MPNVTSNPKSKNGLIIIGIIIILLLIAVVYFVFGSQSIFKAVILFFELLLLLATLFAVAYLFWYLFIKVHKFDVNYVNKKKYIEAGKKQRRKEMKDLYISGDSGHSRVKIGTIVGYLRNQVVVRTYFYDTIVDDATGNTFKKQRVTMNERGEEIPVHELSVEEQDMFIVKPNGVLSTFEDEMVIRLNPNQHNELVGDIDIFGFSLIPIGEYWFLNQDVMEIRKLDYATMREAEQTLAMESMKEWHEVMVKAIGLDTRHIKNVENKALYEIPEVNQNQK